MDVTPRPTTIVTCGDLRLQNSYQEGALRSSHSLLTANFDQTADAVPMSGSRSVALVLPSCVKPDLQLAENWMVVKAARLDCGWENPHSATEEYVNGVYVTNVASAILLNINFAHS